jgi:hypothetical protein
LSHVLLLSDCDENTKLFQGHGPSPRKFDQRDTVIIDNRSD